MVLAAMVPHAGIAASVPGSGLPWVSVVVVVEVPVAVWSKIFQLIRYKIYYACVLGWGCLLRTAKIGGQSEILLLYIIIFFC